MPVAVGSLDSGTCRVAARKTKTPIGRLIRKIARQEIAAISQPPSSGPNAVATPPSPDQAPIARARSAGRKLAWMIARLPGVSSAPPIPWTSRAKISNSTVGAAAQPRPRRR